jgi:preprotein translocase subunit SecG
MIIIIIVVMIIIIIIVVMIMIHKSERDMSSAAWRIGIRKQESPSQNESNYHHTTITHLPPRGTKEGAKA